MKRDLMSNLQQYSSEVYFYLPQVPLIAVAALKLFKHNTPNFADTQPTSFILSLLHLLTLFFFNLVSSVVSYLSSIHSLNSALRSPWSQPSKDSLWKVGKEKYPNWQTKLFWVDWKWEEGGWVLSSMSKSLPQVIWEGSYKSYISVYSTVLGTKRNLKMWVNGGKLGRPSTWLRRGRFE